MQNRIISIDRVESTPTEPVTIAEVKAHLRITITDDDTELTKFITRIRLRVEDFCNISIVTKTIVLIADLRGMMRLPYGPVQSLQTVAVTPPFGTSENLTASDYSLIGTQDAQFQSCRCSIHTINYTVGMTTVPENLKLAILEEIAYHYENKGEETNKFAGEEVGFSKGAFSLLEPFRNLSWI